MPEKKRKRRLGDRKDGRRVRSLDPLYALMPFIMVKRNDACNQFQDSVEVTEIDRYIRRKRQEGLKGFGMLHVMVAAYVRAVSQCPALNRFISGQRIFARNNIEVVMTVKKSMSTSAGETTIKVALQPEDTVDQVYRRMTAHIDEIKRDEAETGTDKTARAFMRLPRFLLRFAVSFLNFLDYFGALPKSLVAVSPFHGSMIITDMGSLGIPPIYHHIYNFGNLPLFISFGAKRKTMELDKDGSPVERKYIDYMIVTDERICDGYYYAQAFKFLKSYLKNPEKLDVPPESVLEDVE